MQVIATETDHSTRQCVTNWLRAHAVRPVVVLASGGSAAPVLVDAWSQLTPDEQSNITFSLADERYGPVDHAESNWLLLQNCGLDLGDERHRPVLADGQDMQATTDAWGAWLEQVITTGTPVLAVLGMGDDSHIAGLKPACPALADTHLAACYDWTDYRRITITPAMLTALTSTVVYVQGERKRHAMDLLQTDQNFHDYPSQLLKQMPDTSVYYQV